jgi:hypothetical protein
VFQSKEGKTEQKVQQEGSKSHRKVEVKKRYAKEIKKPMGFRQINRHQRA